MKVAFLETESEALTHEIKATFRYFGEPEDSKLRADELVAVLAKFLKGFEIALSDIDRITEASAKGTARSSGVTPNTTLAARSNLHGTSNAVLTNASPTATSSPHTETGKQVHGWSRTYGLTP
ncbi:hypothetical protein BASA61_005811 [Batrachochytrium salamandrivorans]|nr:hypothetical protein BASA61_005811 [Batrachochytrium salamandrivorans]